MVNDENFVDVEPKEGMVEVSLTPQDKVMINKNPGGLTKEGCMVRVWHWSQCHNPPTLSRYIAMYKFCKNFVKSGTLEDGNVILAKQLRVSKNGIKKQWVWKEKIGQNDREGNVIIMESVEALEELVKQQLTKLKFIVAKGV